MILDAQDQISQIEKQINKINSALEERQTIINDQIKQLRLMREQKIDLDKQIEL